MAKSLCSQGDRKIDILDLLQILDNGGIQLVRRGDKIVLCGNARLLTPSLIDAARAHKAACEVEAVPH